MKDRLKYFLCTYGWSALTPVILIVVGFVIELFIGDVQVGKSDFIRFNVTGVYLIFGAPLLLALHGIITCAVFKKVFMPSFVLMVSSWLLAVLVELLSGEPDSLAEVFSSQALMFSLLPFIISFVPAVVTFVVLKIREAAKDIQD